MKTKWLAAVLLLTACAVAQVNTTCTAAGNTTNCTSTDVGAQRAQQQQQIDDNSAVIGQGFGNLLALHKAHKQMDTENAVHVALLPADAARARAHGRRVDHLLPVPGQREGVLLGQAEVQTMQAASVTQRAASI
jgi:hypothetical protein